MSNRLPVLAAEIRAAHTDLQEAAKTAAEHAIKAGHALIEAKGLVGHGQWLPWLREHCALSERTAQLYMKIARSGHSPEVVSALGLSAAEKALTLKYCWYQPLFDGDDDTRREWLIYALYACERLRMLGPSYAAEHIDWIGRRDFKTVGEWLTEGPAMFASWGRKMADLRTDFAAFSTIYAAATIADLNAELGRRHDSAPPPVKIARQRRPRRNLKSATVADLAGAMAGGVK